MEVIKGKPLPELVKLLAAAGHPSYRANQLFRWLYQAKENDFAKMTDLAKGFRSWLGENYQAPTLKIVAEEGSEDGTIKYLVQLPDGLSVEAVYIPSANRRVTLCISTQVGCKMACKFCATGYQGFTRNLESWEIVEQLLIVPAPKPITNIVLMGMGEPFDNYDAMKRALEIFQHPTGPQIGKRHITVSTVGLTPRIGEFLESNLGKLAISLHGTTDVQRSELMPINRKYPLEELLAVCRNAKIKGRVRITFEYVLIEGKNDAPEDAHRLVQLMRGIPNKINLLSYNENPYVPFRRPPEERVLRFQEILLRAGLTATYRRSRGRDVAAACGQLRTEHEKILRRLAGKGVPPMQTAAPTPGL